MNIQSFLTLGALIVFSLISLRFNSAVMDNSGSEMENKVLLTAYSLADDMIEEIKVRAFDETTKQFPTSNVLSLTPAANLGKEGSAFDDIDDYNGFSKNISAPHSENYNISCEVKYVDDDDPDMVISTQSFYKKVKITVSSPYLRHNVVMAFIFTQK